MGTEHKRHIHHHYRSSHHLPILCSRSSVRDVRQLSKWENRSAAPSSDEPLSPRVSCIGQVQRTNRVVGFPTPTPHRFISASNSPTTSAAAAASNAMRHRKLRRFFSSSTLIRNTSVVAASSAAAATGSRRQVTMSRGDGRRPGRCRTTDDNNDNYNTSGGTSVNVVDLDPPLPVIKRIQCGAGEGGSLWKRRSGGVVLKSLQLQQIHLPNQPASV
ncbi:uncharacterized protein LOC131161781 [Malania oleifera]|uniref:uncharacterized protein LOC131161781 n=1 Tax=Malania oleifera TaxID=397392 RepID=UPI0025AE1740|nr:uncharacterized protein LOC131161781 [Malania oleifera]